MNSVLLIGQSNMAGRGFFSEAKEVDFSNVFMLRNGRWQAVFRPVHPDRSFSGVCLAESFAEAYVKKYNVEIGLIPCADGGTSLEQWKEGSLLYDNAVNNARLAMRTSNIIGILWHQGESDCRPHLAETYNERFIKMITALKKDLGINVPVIVGGMGDFLTSYKDGSLRDYKKLNAEFQKLADNNENIGFASAEGLKSNPDNLHFCAEALYDFGLRYFAEFDKLYKFESEETVEADTERTEMEKL